MSSDNWHDSIQLADLHTNQFSVIIYGVVYVPALNDLRDLRDRELHQGHFIGHIQ